MQRRDDVDVDDGIIAEEGGEERAVTLLSAPSPEPDEGGLGERGGRTTMMRHTPPPVSDRDLSRHHHRVLILGDTEQPRQEGEFRRRWYFLLIDPAVFVLLAQLETDAFIIDYYKLITKLRICIKSPTSLSWLSS
jgi:hypothetical protein